MVVDASVEPAFEREQIESSAADAALPFAPPRSSLSPQLKTIQSQVLPIFFSCCAVLQPVVVVAVSQMDKLDDCDRHRIFVKVSDEFTAHAKRTTPGQWSLIFVPVSAKDGTNVTNKGSGTLDNLIYTALNVR